jgi:hypothetical protein
MDLQSALLQALKAGGGLHFLTTFLLDRWRKNNGLPPATATAPLPYPTSTLDTDGSGGTAGKHPAGLAYTLYSLDSSLGADVALSLAAALLIPSSPAAGTSTSAAALPGGSSAVPIAAALGGYIVGQNFA